MSDSHDSVVADDPHDLKRFVKAQEHVYKHALAEIRAGQKRSHWMWFIFPQINGLAVSETSRRYAITSIEEARAYLQHQVLGPRLLACGSPPAPATNATPTPAAAAVRH